MPLNNAPQVNLNNATSETPHSFRVKSGRTKSASDCNGAQAIRFEDRCSKEEHLHHKTSESKKLKKSKPFLKLKKNFSKN